MLQLICNSYIRSYIKQCEQCGIEFDPSRDTAKFCSPKCRVSNNRKTSITHHVSRKAHDAVSRAVKTGKLTQLSCEECGKIPSEAHHHKGYATENWLEVKWLCRSHHKLAHPITPNVTLSDPNVTLSFKFTIKRNKTDDTSNPIREAKYWYDIPLAAVPVVQKGWPELPQFMNGRQYFLWWKNEFKESDGVPEILNPFPVHDNIRYEKAGEGSRRWGA